MLELNLLQSSLRYPLPYFGQKHIGQPPRPVIFPPCLGWRPSQFLLIFAVYHTNRICEYASQRIGFTSLSSDAENDTLSLIMHDYTQTDNYLS